MSVSDRSKKRLVLYPWYVNENVLKQKVKFKGVKEAKMYAKMGIICSYTVFDLCSWYHHINIHAEHQKFLVFSLCIDCRWALFCVYSITLWLIFSWSYIYKSCTHISKSLESAKFSYYCVFRRWLGVWYKWKVYVYDKVL